MPAHKAGAGVACYTRNHKWHGQGIREGRQREGKKGTIQYKVQGHNNKGRKVREGKGKWNGKARKREGKANQIIL